MSLLQKYSATYLTIEIINACVESSIHAFAPSGPVLEIGSYYDPQFSKISDRRKLFKGLEYIGCDIRQGPGVDRIDDAETLQLPDGSAGAVLLLETLEHLTNPTIAIAHALRVLRDDGLLILSVPFSYRLHGFPTDYWRFSASGVHHLLAACPQRSIVSLGAGVKPMTIFAVAAKDGFKRFSESEEKFKAQMERVSVSMRRKLFACAMQERARDLVGLVTGRAAISARFFDAEQAGAGYKAGLPSQE